MSNIVIKVDHGGIQTLKDFYNPFIIDRTPPGAVFSAKLTNCTITAYKSGKVLFQGSAAQQEANRWEKTAKTAPSQTENELQQLQQMSVIGSDEAGTGIILDRSRLLQYLSLKKKENWFSSLE